MVRDGTQGSSRSRWGPPGTSNGDTALECSGIAKDYGAGPVLQDVNLSVKAGAVTALVGENGAGKSTLLSIFAGLIPASAGTVKVFGREIDAYSPTIAQLHGIRIVAQELMLMPDLQVWENITLGRTSERRNRLGVRVIDRDRMVGDAARLIEDFGVPMDPQEYLRNLSLSYAQVVEVLKAIHADPLVLLLDEPTSALTESEVEKLFRLVRNLKTAGTTVVFTSHKLQEVEDLADEVVVLRDGRITLSGYAGDFSRDQVIRSMIGRSLENVHFARPKVQRSSVPRLQVDRLRVYESSPELDLVAYPGEIVGIAGIAGAGRSSILQCVAAVRRAAGGSVLVDGARVQLRRPHDAIKLGIGYVPEDRKVDGLLPDMSIVSNVSLPLLQHYVSGPVGMISAGAETADTLAALRALNTDHGTEQTPARRLSGGNQQKLLFGRWMIQEAPRLLLLDEPTRGIDVGAKAELYEHIARVAEQGVTVLVASSELPELMLLSHRILVLRDGAVAAEFRVEDREYSEEEIVRAAIGEADVGAPDADHGPVSVRHS